MKNFKCPECGRLHQTKDNSKIVICISCGEKMKEVKEEDDRKE